MPAVEGYATMGLSADLVEVILHNYETELVGAVKERRVRALLQASGAIAAGDFTSTITAAQLAAHEAQAGALTLANAVGYDLWTVAPKISKRYADVTTTGDKPSLVQRRRAARRGAGADAARGVRATANCFLSWHLVAPLLELVAAQRAQEEMDGAPIFVWNWNNLFL